MDIIILVILIIISIQDIRLREVSNYASLFFILIALIEKQINIERIFISIIIILPFIITNHIIKDNFGYGDIKIIITLSLMLGLRCEIILMIALILCYITQNITKKQNMPFIPYITIGYIIVKILI